MVGGTAAIGEGIGAGETANMVVGCWEFPGSPPASVGLNIKYLSGRHGCLLAVVRATGAEVSVVENVEAEFSGEGGPGGRRWGRWWRVFFEEGESAGCGEGAKVGVWFSTESDGALSEAWES